MKETIKAKINKDGTIEVSVEGTKGKSCLDATADLEVFLGKTQAKEMTADYYKKEDPGKPTWITRK